MTKKWVVITIIVLFALSSVGLFLALRNVNQPTSNVAITDASASTQPSNAGSLMSLISSGQNQQCLFTDQESQSSGTLYIGTGKTRGDFQSQSGSIPSVSHMITDGETVYVWIDQQNEGFKLSKASIEKIQRNPPQGAPKMVDLNKQVDFKCTAWQVNQALLTPPTDVTFNDFTVVLEQMQKMTSSTSTASAAPTKTPSCNTCDILAEPAKAQCRAALKCN